MKYQAKKFTLIFHTVCLLFHSVLLSHGFGANTVVELDNGSRETMYDICLYSLDNTVSVASYDLHNYRIINQPVETGKRSKTNCYIRLGFEPQLSSNDDILCAPTQEFYVPAQQEWVQAYKLQLGDALLTKGMTVKSLMHKKCVAKSLKIYMLEIRGSHTFFVGKHSLLTHNILLPIAASLGFVIPFGSVATGTLGSFFGPVSMIGGMVFGSMLGVGIKVLCEKRLTSYKTSAFDVSIIKSYCQTRPRGCFSSDHKVDTTYTHIIPVENPLPPTTTGCIEIKIDSQQGIKGCHKVPEQENIRDNGCFQPAEQDKQLCNTQDKSSIQENPKPRYKGPTARTWKEFDENTTIGQIHGKKFIHIGKQNPKDGAPIRQLSEDIPNTEMFKEDYYYALDRYHGGDHLEVWDPKGNWIGVANLDGSKNHKKSNAEKDKPSRSIKKII